VLSSTGKRQELFFATKSEAQTSCEQLKARRDNFGISLSTMSAARLAEASEAFKLLEPYGVGLLDCVREHVAILEQRNSSVTLGEAFDAFAALKENRSDKYLGEIRGARNSFASILAMPICDVTANHITPLLPIAPAARNAKLRRLCSVFNLAIRREWFRGANPTEKIDRAETLRKEVEVFTPDQVEQMLNYALANDLEFLPFLTLATFCGIRPEGEMSRIAWSDIRTDAGRRIVLVPAIAAKTKKKRPVDLSDNAQAWLDAYRVHGGKCDSLIVPFSETTLIRKRRAMCAQLGLRWIQQGLRHTFCSYWLAMHHDVNRLVLQSGHDNPATMWQHYFQGILDSDAKRFWSITPQG
jgi:integrase